MTGMTCRDQLSCLISTFLAATGMKSSVLSRRIFNSGFKADQIVSGEADVFTSTFERAVQYFSDNWPADHGWPAGIARPSPSRSPKLEGAE